MKPNIKLLVGMFVILFSLASCQSGGVTKHSDGLTVSLNDPSVKKVRLNVISPDIIRVTATANSSFIDNQSLSVIETPEFTDWTYKIEGDLVTITTSAMNAIINKSTGEVCFTDLKGNILLQENKGGGKTIEPMSVDGVDGYAIRQVFESPADEAFYGLGQHQVDDMNYKGKNETLFQYNTKVSIPFIVSNKNYGILWDNYSLSRFGDPRDYMQISELKLYDAEGNPGGLTATYSITDRTGVNQVFEKRTESSIDYENLQSKDGIPTAPRGIRGQVYATWEGDFEAKEAGLYHFQLYYAGYTQLYIDGELTVDKWRTNWNPSYARFALDLKPGEKHHIKIDWNPEGGAYIGLKLLTPVDPKEQTKLSMFSEMGDQIDYYFIKGNSMDGVIKGYRYITGKAQVMPKWAMGFWQSRERYKTQDEILSTINEFRKRQIPIDNIVLDWSYWEEDQWGSHEFEAERFPDPKGMVDAIHDQNAKIMISVWPKFYINTEHYKEFDQRGWMFKRAVDDSIRDWIGRGYIGSFYDAYNADARKLFWKQMEEHLLPIGFDAWWMDASEPDIESNNSVDYRKALMNPTDLGPSTKYFNAYALVNAMAIYNGQRSVLPNQRVFLLTRSGFLGSQRYGAATWSGDIGTRWEDFRSQISAGLNFALAGNPYWTMDIGGFCVESRYTRAKEGSEDMEEWRELNSRWTQFGAFVPLFRSHGQFPYREVYNIAPESHPAYKSMVYYTKLRYRLMPYIYTMAGQVYHNDYTIMRAMAMDFGYDKNVLDIGDQYMFGPGLLVAPVYKYKARSREVYLPEDTNWYDFYNGDKIEGGKTITANAPYERMPIFVKEGSIVPFGPEIQYSSEKPDAPITVVVYCGQDGTFTLYEDQGSNYDYEKGQFSTIPMSYNEALRTLTIGDRNGSFEGMVENRTFNVIFVDKYNKKGFDSFTSDIAIPLQYNGKSINLVNPNQY